MKIFELITKYFGKIEYIVTVINVSGSVEHHPFFHMDDVDSFVDNVNAEMYWDVQKIEKLRRYDIKYKKLVVHSPLFFSLEDVTETENLWGNDFSFIKKDKSLNNINRVSTKETIKNEKSKKESSLCD